MEKLDKSDKESVLKFSVTCWKDKKDFLDVYQKIYGEESTLKDKESALERLLVWKIRRCQETPNGVLCTSALLDVIIKDQAKIITDKSVLINLYSLGLTKFLNLSASFEKRERNMYRSANSLGIDSFIVDLRHLVAHGRDTPSIEVFQRSADYCMTWLKSFYWEREIENIADTTISEILTADSLEFEQQAKHSLVIYDTILEAMHKGYRYVDRMMKDESPRLKPERWTILMNFIKHLKESKNLRNMKDVLKEATESLFNFMGSKEMCRWHNNFFSVLIQNCSYFMSIDEKTICTPPADEQEANSQSDSDEPEIKKPKWNYSIIPLTKDFIFAIAKHDYLKQFLEKLLQVTKESSNKKSSAIFWIKTILNSFNYFQKFCSHFENLQDIMLQKKAGAEILDFYTGTLCANLQEIYVLVGAQVMPNSLKFSEQFLEEFLKDLNEDNQEICLSLLPLIHPPLSNDQSNKIKYLISILTSSSKGKAPTEVHTIEDLKSALSIENKDVEIANGKENIWKLAPLTIDWSCCPIGNEFF